MSQTTVRIWWDASIQAYRLSSSYNKDFVDALKNLIPASDRSFDPQSKIWTFVEKWLGPIQSFCKTAHVVPTLITRQQAEQAAQARPSASPSTGVLMTDPNDRDLLDFAKLLTFESAQAAYRRAALALHPDKGGDMAQMSKLNAVWQRLEKNHWRQS